MEMSRELSHRYFPARLPGPRDPRVTVEHITRRPTRPRSPSRVWSLGGGGGRRTEGFHYKAVAAAFPDIDTGFVTRAVSIPPPAEPSSWGQDAP